MTGNDRDQSKKFLYIYADCLITKGAKRTLVYNTSSGEAYFLSSSYYIFFELFRKYPLTYIYDIYIDSESKEEFTEFVTFLINSNLGIMLENIDSFPLIDYNWDSYSQIENSIIDVNEIFHDFESIFNQLDKMLCKFLLIRFYSDKFTELSILESIASIPYLNDNISILGIQLMIPSSNNISETGLLNLIKAYPIIRVIYVYNSLEDRSVNDRIIFMKQNLTSERDCGFISESSILLEKSLQLFIESQNHNSCLNRKLSIDQFGEIKNCPAMLNSFGNIKSTSLLNIAENEIFKQKWDITKDNISICKDCEYRYICSDCRGNTVNGETHSKPLYCNYNPYEGIWEDH